MARPIDAGDVVHYRRMADVCQRQLDEADEAVDGPAHLERLGRERDQWLQLADELEIYLQRYDEGAWDAAEPVDAPGLF